MCRLLFCCTALLLQQVNLQRCADQKLSFLQSTHELSTRAQVACLNEATAGSAKHVFRAWGERLQDPAIPLDSNEEDPELLITIPFNGAVKIKAISIIGGAGSSSPSRLKAYINRHDLDFAAVADMAPVQAWDLQQDQQANMEYPTQ